MNLDFDLFVEIVGVIGGITLVVFAVANDSGILTQLLN